VTPRPDRGVFFCPAYSGIRRAGETATEIFLEFTEIATSGETDGDPGSSTEESCESDYIPQRNIILGVLLCRSNAATVDTGC
jgi:hypothetical protein